MVVNNWIEANLIWITLAITILVLMYFVYAIIQTIRNRKRRSFVSQLNIILLILGLMFLIFLTYHANEIEGKDWGQIILMLGLVIVTALYASSSVKMAEEMRSARYDALRPVVDIVTMKQQPRDTIDRGLDVANGKPLKVLCKLRNVGVGPALELYSFEDVGGNPRRCDFGTIPVATGKEEWGYTREEQLLVIQRNNQSALVVKYKDVYGNLFESIREVSVNKDKKAFSISPLKVCSLSKKEHVND